MLKPDLSRMGSNGRPESLSFKSLGTTHIQKPGACVEPLKNGWFDDTKFMYKSLGWKKNWPKASIVTMSGDLSINECGTTGSPAVMLIRKGDPPRGTKKGSNDSCSRYCPDTVTFPIT
jgi:hypothetical protein